MILANDMQNSKPSIHISLNRVGITGITKIIAIGSRERENLFYSELDLYVDLHPDRAGVHMSRFSEEIIDAVDEVVKERALDIESFTHGLAAAVLERQEALRSEVHVWAKYPLRKKTPASRVTTQDICTLIGVAAGRKGRVRGLVGVEAAGLTACPCAQEMVRAYTGEELLQAGFTPEQVQKVLAVTPLASHNQRGRGTLLLGTSRKVQAQDLVTIVEGSMSSPIYDLLKRPDEFHVIKEAHRQPRFVEDVVRHMVEQVVEGFPHLEDEAFLLAKQVNYEGIHSYDVFAEKQGTMGEIRREVLRGEHVTRPTSLAAWLDPGD